MWRHLRGLTVNTGTIFTFHTNVRFRPLPECVIADIAKHDSVGGSKFWPKLFNFSVTKASFSARQPLGHFYTLNISNATNLYFVDMTPLAVKKCYYTLKEWSATKGKLTQSSPLMPMAEASYSFIYLLRILQARFLAQAGGATGNTQNIYARIKNVFCK